MKATETAAMLPRLISLPVLALTAMLTITMAACAGADNGGGDAANDSGLAQIELLVGERVVTAEVADTHESRRQGLMHRESLPADHGMLFVYSRAYELSFWMKNTPLPLDIAFIDRTGFIVDIQAMAPLSTQPHRSPLPVPYALEMRQGWFADNGIEAGDRVSGLPSPASAE